MHNKTGEEGQTSVDHELSQLRKTGTQGFIYRVHEHLRSVNRQAYEPAIVAIGPYHRDKDSCKMMEEHKLRYLRLLLDSKNETTAQRYISAIGELEEEARNCYTEPINLSQDKFIKMLVLDGCFIIELVRNFEKSDYICIPNDPIFEMKWIRSGLRRDLILIENQIPFFVLCKLFDLVEGPNQHDRLINLVLYFCKNLFPDKKYKKLKISCSHDVKHLLDLVYSWWTPNSFDGAVKVDLYCSITANRASTFIHSATMLKNANVKFKRRESCDSLFEIKFENGTMLMPPFRFGDKTECFFRNLIAYEQYFQPDRNSYVRHYVKFIDLLINSYKDVDVLSECEIIDNWLGDNEVIANIFNRLHDSVTSAPRHIYMGTFIAINTHYNKRWKRWMAVLNRDYLSSPWGCISIFAALLLLVLTLIQSVCSVLQVITL